MLVRLSKVEHFLEHGPAGALREEREWLERGKGTRLYDTTAWSMPFLYGVDAYWTAAKPAGDWRNDEPQVPKGSLAKAEPVFGYLFDGTSDRSVAALADLLHNRLEDLVAELQSYVDSIEVDERRLEAVEERLDALNRLKRKYGGSLAAVVEKLASSTAELSAIENISTGIAAVEDRLRERHAATVRQAAALSKKREAAAQRDQIVILAASYKAVTRDGE